MPYILLLQWFFVFFAGSQAAHGAPAKPIVPLANPAAAGAVHIQVRNGLFHVMDGVLLRVPRLEAWMIPKPGEMVSLDNKNSFTMQIASGETYLTAQDLTNLLNNYLLPHAETPIKNITITFEGNEVAVKGDLHKLVNIPFKGRGVVSLENENEIRMHFTDLTAAGVVKKGFLDALGLKLSSVAQPEKQSRFRIEDDDILLPITALFPPPRISGKLTAVRIANNVLVQVFGSSNAEIPPPPTPAANYLYFHGGRMKFGKLTMDDVDLELVDMDPKNDFDFSLDHYAEQLVAGYSKSLSNGGLVAYVPDYSAVAKSQKKH